MTIPFLDLKKINAPYSDEIKSELAKVVDTGWYILGGHVQNFENNYASYSGVAHCVGLASGLDALELILAASEFPKGSEIIVPANTYYATILAIVNQGLTPILIEPNPETYLLDLDLAEKAITPNTKAIFFVELYGKAGNYDKLIEIGQKHNLKLFSDNAQSHGALYNKKNTSYFFDAVAVSFYPTKNLGALGDAGCVLTNNPELAERIKTLRNYGSNIKYHFQYLGKNSRLDDLQASALNVKLQYLDEITNRRRDIAKKYLSEIKNPKIELPSSDAINEDAWHLFVLKCNERERLTQYLTDKNIGWDIHYPIPPHKQVALQSFENLNLPITEKLHKQVLSIPLNQSLLDEEVDYIILHLNKFN